MNSTERHERRYQRRRAARFAKRSQLAAEYGDFESVFSFDHLYTAYRASAKAVGWKASTQRYKASALPNVYRTHRELLAGTFKSRGFFEFDIVERGKPRHIRSVHITERVVQRCLCDFSLVPMLSRSFIYDNGASLKGKGLRLRRQARYSFPCAALPQARARGIRSRLRLLEILRYRAARARFPADRAQRHRRAACFSLRVFHQMLR